jgi:hypothetical protein
MLRSLKDLMGYLIVTLEGVLGKTEDFYFDNKDWIIRYMVVSLGGSGSNKKVLIPPADLIDKPDWDSRSFALNISREEAEKSPGMDTEKPVTRKREKEVHDYFSLPFYWAQASFSGPAAPGIAKNTEKEPDPGPEDEESYGHLHSARDVMGYKADAIDENAGGIDDMIVDDGNWEIRFVAVAGKKGIFSKKRILVSPDMASLVDHERKTVVFRLEKEEMAKYPEYDPEEGVNRVFEEKNYDYRGKPK